MNDKVMQLVEELSSMVKIKDGRSVEYLKNYGVDKDVLYSMNDNEITNHLVYIFASNIILNSK